WAIWFGGIVLLDTDVVFTASNVLAHGVPYVALVRRYGASRWRGASSALGRLFSPRGGGVFLLLLVAAADLEESLWDGLVWHDRESLFPLRGFVLSDSALAMVVPLLALPQATHYVLDAFLWKPGSDPALAARLGLPTAKSTDDGPLVSAAVR